MIGARAQLLLIFIKAACPSGPWIDPAKSHLIEVKGSRELGDMYYPLQGGQILGAKSSNPEIASA
jgi:hypothetical protein